jgi:glycosyltransferase involved in cell wall biosynthesis
VGRLSAEKDIERIKPILLAFPEARLALVGDGPHHKTLERHFAGLPVHLAGFLHGEDLAAAYASADIFVMPSRTETLGLVILEAMASGLPVVAARDGGIPEIVQEGVSGFLFGGEDEAIAHISRLLPSPELRQSIGLAARAHAVQHGWKTATQQLVAHYQAACKNQHIDPNPAPDPAQRTLGARIGRALGQAALFAARKLLP